MAIQMKQKFLIITTTPLIVSFFLKEHIKALAEDFEVDLALPLTVGAEGADRLHELPCRLVDVDVSRRPSLVSDLRALVRIRKLMLRERYDIVWGVGPKAGMIGALAGWLVGVRHRVFVFQGEVWASRLGLRRWLLRSIDKLTGALSTALLAVSESEKNFLVGEGVVRADEIEVLGDGTICGVDPERFRACSLTRARVRAELGFQADDVICLFVGRITRDKGVEALLEAYTAAAKAVPKLALLLVGPVEDQSLNILLRRRIEMNDRIKVVGYTEAPEQYFATADFLCLPSLREGFGMVVLEAAACGLPSVCTRIPGLVDAVDYGRAGVLVDVGDVDGLCRVIVRFGSDSGERREIGDAARSRVVKKFVQNDVVRRYVEFFKAL